jgi:hypothetical protein
MKYKFKARPARLGVATWRLTNKFAQRRQERGTYLSAHSTRKSFTRRPPRDRSKSLLKHKMEVSYLRSPLNTTACTPVFPAVPPEETRSLRVLSHEAGERPERSPHPDLFLAYGFAVDDEHQDRSGAQAAGIAGASSGTAGEKPAGSRWRTPQNAFI